jgi:hypothetical protein
VQHQVTSQGPPTGLCGRLWNFDVQCSPVRLDISRSLEYRHKIAIHGLAQQLHRQAALTHRQPLISYLNACAALTVLSAQLCSRGIRAKWYDDCEVDQAIYVGVSLLFVSISYSEVAWKYLH